MPEIHLWLAGSSACTIEIRQTEPNHIQLRAAFRMNGRFYRLEPELGQSNQLRLHLSDADMRKLTIRPPNWDGHFLVLDTLHTLHPHNETQYWGWTYRLLRDGAPLSRATDADGQPLRLDRAGWIEWPRARRDFGELVSVMDQVVLELHG